MKSSLAKKVNVKVGKFLGAISLFCAISRTMKEESFRKLLFTWVARQMQLTFVYILTLDRITTPKQSNFSKNSSPKIREKIHKQGLGEFVIGIFVSKIMYFRGWHRFELNLHLIQKVSYPYFDSDLQRIYAPKDQFFPSKW